MQRDGIDRSKSLEEFLADINILPIADAIDIAAKEKIRLRFHSASAPLNSFSSKRLAVSWKKLKFAGKKEVTE